MRSVRLSLSKYYVNAKIKVLIEFLFLLAGCILIIPGVFPLYFCRQDVL